MSNCSTCCNIHKSTSIVDTGSSGSPANAIAVSFPDTANIVNQQRFCFVLCQSIPATTTPEPVYLVINGNNVPLLDCFGNTVYSNTISSRKLYKGVYGNNSAHVLVYNLPCRCMIGCGQ